MVVGGQTGHGLCVGECYTDEHVSMQVYITELPMLSSGWRTCQIPRQLVVLYMDLLPPLLSFFYVSSLVGISYLAFFVLVEGDQTPQKVYPLKLVADLAKWRPFIARNAWESNSP